MFTGRFPYLLILKGQMTTMTYIDETPRQAEISRHRLMVVMLHILLWAIFLSVPTLFNPFLHKYTPAVFVYDLWLPMRRINALLFILVFYFNYYIAIPRFYLRRRYLALVLSFLVAFLAFFLVNSLIHWGRHQQRGFFAFGNIFHTFMFIVVYASSFALCVYEQWQKEKEEKLNAEIAFLKAQINPHFLFNTLNSIYSLAITNSEKTADAVVKLSGMMRYTVSEADKEYVSLQQEVDYLNNYIQLQMLRVADRTKVTHDLGGEFDAYRIAPFLLIPFVENAFKYGVSPEEDSWLGIELRNDKGAITLSVRNKKASIRHDMDHNTGLGIKTTQRRLQLLYPGRHSLDIIETPDEFTVLLTIQLT
jgi:two-component sensor histidine kinase